MAIKHTLLVLLFAASSCPLFAQKNTFPDHMNTVLWGVVNKTGDTSFLFGTFHEFGSSYITQNHIREKTRGIACVAFETDVNAIDSVMQQAKTTNAATWLPRLTKDEKRSLKKLLHDHKSAYSVKQMGNVPVSDVIYSLQVMLYTEKCQIVNDSDGIGMEDYLYFKAQRAKLKTTGLEPISFTLHMLDTVLKANTGKVDLVDTMKYILKDPAIFTSALPGCEEVDNYRKHTVDYKFTTPSVTEDSTLPYMVDKRNDNWMPVIESLIAAHKTLIAVGFRHLGYTKGLINQLISRGYIVFPIEMD